MPDSRDGLSRLALLWLSAALAMGATAQTKTATSTALTVTAASGAVTSIATGTVVTLTASVKAGSATLTTGEVDFCDATAKYCTDIHVLGMAQLTSAGTATLKFRPGIGSHSYKAVFLGTNAYAGSASDASGLTVTGSFPTVTTIQTQCCANPYTLTATVSGIVDSPAAPGPTGTVTFPDTSYGNTNLATATLGAATAGINFVESRISGSLDGSNAIAAGDFNGDGIPDVALASGPGTSGSVDIYLGKGDGTFNPVSATLAVGEDPAGIAVADFNGDGIPDLAVPGVTPQNLTILLGKGDGTFPTTQTITLTAAPIGIVAADFNGDGLPDLAVLTGDSVITLLGKGDGTFTQVSAAASVSSPEAIAAGDFNGDGVPDLAVSDIGNGTLTILLGRGNGTFTPSYVSLGSGFSPAELVVADFNGDGKADVAVSSFAIDGETAVMFGNGNGTFQAAMPIDGAYGGGQMAAADFNGDGIPDLAIGGGEYDPPLVFLGNGDGTFGPNVVVGLDGLLSSGNLATADLNGDGVTDIIEPEDAGEGFAVELSQPTETATAAANNINPAGPAPHEVEAQYSGDSHFSASTSAATDLNVQAATPVLSLAPGTYTTTQTLTITEASQGATIYYSEYGTISTNGFVPYTGPISFSEGGEETVQAYATATGYEQSTFASANYLLNLPRAPAPAFSLQAGTYSGAQTLTISDSVAGATIYYTTDGTTPTNLSATYSGSITISSSEVVSAFAIAPAYSSSPATTARYLISSAATPFIYTVAGTEGAGFGGDGGPATFALLNAPSSVAEDSQGNLFIADSYNNVIRKVAAGTGLISTIAGTGNPGYSGDNGAATAAQLNGPSGVALDSAGDLYIADSENSVVRRIAASTGTITTVAGNGTFGNSGDGGPATSADMYSPSAVIVDSAGNLYISDSEAGRIRKVAAATGTITTYAGGASGLSSGSIGDGGPATSATLAYPLGLALDNNGNLYIADSDDEVIREVNASTGNISTVAGSYSTEVRGGYGGDGGPATSATLNQPSAVALDNAGNLYIADAYNYRIRKVTASTGDIATLAGNGGDCSGVGGDGDPAADAPLCYPGDLIVDSGGNLYFTEIDGHVRKVTPAIAPPATATATPTFTVQPGSYPVSQTVTLADAVPGAEIYLTFDGTTPSTGGQGYRSPVDVNGSVTLKAIAVAPGYLPSAMATAAYTISAPPPAVVSTVAGNGTNFPGSAGLPATATSLLDPLDVAVDAAGNLYIADATNDVVWQVAAATGTATVFAGALQSPGYSGNGGPATSAQLNGPNHVAVDRAGNVYISDGGSDTVRVVTAATGIISTYAGTYVGSGATGDGGPATSAHLDNPEGLAIDAAGNLYIADAQNERVRMVTAATGIITTIAGGGSSPGPAQGDGGPATSASLSYPWDLALDPQGNLYIADTSYARVRKVSAATQIISTVAGNGDRGSSGDGLPATRAEAAPSGLAVDGTGDLYISSGYVVRELPAGSNILTTFAGTGYSGSVVDGGSATLADFCEPEGMTFDPGGNLYIADPCDQRIRKVTFSNTVATPTFNLAAGMYSSPQSVEIADTTEGAIIYYTTDGSTPTPHANVYNTAIAVNQSETLKAIAVAGGYANSSIATANYTINLTTPTLTVTPSSTSITTAQSLGVTVTISGGTGNPTPTGSITLSSGSYNAQQTLVSGAATFTISAGALAVGNDTLQATYTPNSASSGTYTTATRSTTVSVTTPIGTAVATVAVTPGVTNLTNAQTLTVTVAVTGAVDEPTPTGSVTLRAGAWSNQQTLSSGDATFTVPAGTLSSGSNNVTAAYSGDATYAVASGTAAVTVSPVVSSGQTPSTISPGSSATSTISFSSGTTYSGTMNLTCALTASPTGAQSLPTCSMNPTSVILASGGNVTSTLAVDTTAAGTTAQLHPFRAPLRWLGGGGVTLAAVLLFGIPARRRRWASMLALLLAIVALGTVGCSGGNSSGSGGGGGGGGGQTIPATTAGNYTFTVTGTDSVNAQITTSTTVVVTVQ